MAQANVYVRKVKEFEITQPLSGNSTGGLNKNRPKQCSIDKRTAQPVVWGVTLVVALLLGACGKSSPHGLIATVRQHVHPVLIRNEHNVLLQVDIDSNGTSPGRLQSIEFILDGDNVGNDIESLAVYSTGAKEEFSPAVAFGESMQSSAKAVFHGDQPLQPGTNVFWLSCRLRPDADLSHKVSATLASVGTSEGVLGATGLAGLPGRIGIALRKHNDDGVHTYRIPSLATGPSGTLYAVYDMRRRMSRDLQEDIDIGLGRSVDGGRNWEAARVIIDMGKYGGLPEEQNGVSDPGIVVDQKTGEIFVFAVWMSGKPGKHQWTDDGSEPGFEIGKSAQLMMVRSKDDGLTWTKPENLTRALKKAAWWLLAPSPQQGINLADGTLVLPAQGRDEKGVPFATLIVSRDHGSTWSVGEPAFSGGNECQAVELGDGSIMLNMRNDHERYRAVFVTTDLGKTWRAHSTNRNTLIEPNCNASLRQVDFQQGGESKHILLFANPHSQERRVNQTIQLSFDDGRTWPEEYHMLLDEGLGRGYPSISQVDDQHIGIVYEGSQADVVFEKISLDELLKR